MTGIRLSFGSIVQSLTLHPAVGGTMNLRFPHEFFPGDAIACPVPISMKQSELDRLLRAAPPTGSPGAGFADAILAKLPGMRFVIPGSHPGLRVLVLAGVMGLLTAVGVSLLSRPPGSASNPQPPPLTLFQPGAVEPARPLPPP